MTSKLYSAPDVVRGYAWLGHAAGVTEVGVLHPEYRPGELVWNREHRTWPITTYLTTYEELQRLVAQYAGSRMVCYGLNPRPGILTRSDGRLRSAREADIVVSQNLVLDIDLHGDVTTERLQRLAAFVDETSEYFTGLGIKTPDRAKTGRGSHLLFAYPPITVAEHPNFRAQLKSFKQEFVRSHRQELGKLEAVVDSTQDLRRMVRVYGTSKPNVGIVSRFLGGERVPDERLREYLLQLTPATNVSPADSPEDLVLSDSMPAFFPSLLEKDQALNELWHGRGKPSTADTSASGYDFSIAVHLAQHGKTADEIATIISHRPTGATERQKKGSDYLQRTVTNALHNAKQRGPR